MNTLIIAYIFIGLGMIPYAFIIHLCYIEKRLSQGKDITTLLILQKISLFIQIAFGIIGLFLQVNYLFNWL